MTGTTAKPNQQVPSVVPAPDKLVLLLVILEVLLMFTGFQSGWMALLGVAVFLLAILSGLAWFLVTLAFKKRPQFSVLSLLGLMACSAIVCSWFTGKIHRAKRHQEIIEKWERLELGYTYSPSPSAPFQLRLQGTMSLCPPQCLQRLFGFYFFAEINAIRSRCDVRDEDLKLLEDFAGIEWLSLSYTQVTDAAIPELKQFSRLRELDLTGTAITDEGILELRKALPTCAIIRQKAVSSDRSSIGVPQAQEAASG